MKLEELHIGVSPLTDTIYLGTVPNARLTAPDTAHRSNDE